MGGRQGGWSLAGMQVWNGSNWHFSDLRAALGEVCSSG